MTVVYERFLPSTEFSARTVEGPHRGVVVHHAVTTSLVALETLMDPGGRTVSAHEAVADGVRVKKVPHGMRAFSLGSPWADSAFYTMECVNSTLSPDYLLADGTEEAIAQAIAEDAKRCGWVPHREGDPKTWTVLGHREVYTIHGVSYATACPGGARLDRITQRAQQILLGSNGDAMPLMFVKVKGTDPIFKVGDGPAYLFASRNEFDTYCEALKFSGHSVPPVIEAASSWTRDLLIRTSAPKPVVDSAPIIAAVVAAIKAQNVEVDFAPVLAAIEGVNANIDDAPTLFQAVPKE